MTTQIERVMAKRIRKTHQRLKDRCYKIFSSRQGCIFFSFLLTGSSSRKKKKKYSILLANKQI